MSIENNKLICIHITQYITTELYLNLYIRIIPTHSPIETVIANCSGSGLAIGMIVSVAISSNNDVDQYWVLTFINSE